MTTVTHADRPIAEPRQTSLGLYVTAKEAYDMWQADPEAVKILDVRTPEEWVFTGHAPMATNIPFAFLAYAWDEEKKGFPWEVNPEFVDLVKARFAPTDTLLVSCRSGGRAAMAINMLAAVHEHLQHPRRDGGSRSTTRQRVPRHAAEERLEGLGPAVDVRPRPRADGLPERETGRSTRQPGD
jgi:rhodanese-related sulfurtransferase